MNIPQILKILGFVGTEVGINDNMAARLFARDVAISNSS